MIRRRYLAVAGTTLLVAASGCSEEGAAPISKGTGTGGATGTSDYPEPETSEASDVAGDIRIVVRATAAEGANVRLTVSRDGSVHFEEEIEIPSNASRTVDSGIDETGRYELAVSVEGGPSESYPFTIGEYDLQMGSNLVVRIDEEDVWIAIEE